ncbi:MAG TPA: hypothetical protein VMB21_18445, partial [Candidatus Limnocylindria bacterium]|nr:hypothetical protein [Candidatus Limnocylindria bacterium]
KIFVGPMDWFLIVLLLGAAVAGLFAGGGGPLLAIFCPIVALLIWWLNVAPHYPRIGQGPDD